MAPLNRYREVGFWELIDERISLFSVARKFAWRKTLRFHWEYAPSNWPDPILSLEKREP